MFLVAIPIFKREPSLVVCLQEMQIDFALKASVKKRVLTLNFSCRDFVVFSSAGADKPVTFSACLWLRKAPIRVGSYSFSSLYPLLASAIKRCQAPNMLGWRLLPYGDYSVVPVGVVAFSVASILSRATFLFSTQKRVWERFLWTTLIIPESRPLRQQM